MSDFHPFTVKHQPSGDEAEADTREAAVLAARTLLEDNEWQGQCLVLQGKKVLDMVWANDSSAYTHLNTCHQD